MLSIPGVVQLPSRGVSALFTDELKLELGTLEVSLFAEVKNYKWAGTPQASALDLIVARNVAWKDVLTGSDLGWPKSNAVSIESHDIKFQEDSVLVFVQVPVDKVSLTLWGRGIRPHELVGDLKSPGITAQVKGLSLAWIQDVCLLKSWDKGKIWACESYLGAFGFSGSVTGVPADVYWSSKLMSEFGQAMARFREMIPVSSNGPSMGWVSRSATLTGFTKPTSPVRACNFEKVCRSVSPARSKEEDSVARTEVFGGERNDQTRYFEPTGFPDC